MAGTVRGCGWYSKGDVAGTVRGCGWYSKGDVAGTVRVVWLVQ